MTTWMIVVDARGMNDGRPDWEERTIESFCGEEDIELEAKRVAHRMWRHWGGPRLTQRGKTSWRLDEPGTLDAWVRAERVPEDAP